MNIRTITIAVLAVLICAGLAVSAQAAKPGTDFNGQHYNLNIIGKDKFNGVGGDGRTIFVPENTSEYNFTVYDKGVETVLDGVRINVTQGPEFAVTDGNAFDGTAGFELVAGEKYNVFIAAKAKPAKPGQDLYTMIKGWVRVNDTYYFDIGDVTVKKSKNSPWQDATHIFEVDSKEDPLGIVDLVNSGNDMWVFDYIAALEAGSYGADDPCYFWQYDNHGNKLVQIRFYPV